MVDIILVGCGKAGAIHCKCYSKLENSDLNVNIVGLVDSDLERLKKFKILYEAFTEVKSPLAANSLKELSSQIDIENAIIDLCVPNDMHYRCSKEAVDLGVKKIIIEKPISNSIVDAKKIEALDAKIAIVENYVYSKVTEQLKETINKNHFIPKFARTEFSKDRRYDTTNGRGFLQIGPPHVFTVEIPHQIALANYLFGNPVDNFGAWCEDMITDNIRFYEHGEGAITLHHETGTISYNFSSLDGHKHLPIRHRSIMIHCEGGIRVSAHYPAGGDDALFGAVTVFDTNHISEKLSIYDDNMFETLKNIILRFGENGVQITDPAFGSCILERINESIQLARMLG
jgi:predicted dehydrogenase